MAIVLMILIFIFAAVFLVSGIGCIFMSAGGSEVALPSAFVILSLLFFIGLWSFVYSAGQNSEKCHYKGGKYSFASDTCRKVGSTIDLSK